MTNSPDHNDEFTVFFEKEYRSIVAMVMSAGASFEDAEDAVIETMHLAATRFHELETPGAWVRKVAIRRFIRKRQRDVKRERREQLGSPPVEKAQLNDGNLARLVSEVLDGLPPIQRKVMAYHIDGYSPAEVAQLMDSPQDTVRSNLRHARRTIAAALKEAGWHLD